MTDTIMEFPCEFPIKVFGRHEHDFENLIVEIVSRHVQDLSADNVRRRASKESAYLALTITITAHSKEQLDNIYQDLTDCEQVIMAL